MKITADWLEEKHACPEGIEWLKNQPETDAVPVLNALIHDNREEWANWLIVRVMSRPDYLRYAVFAAEQVIGFYEEKYPDDKRPREAIEAAKRCIENDTQKNRAVAWAAARAASWAASDAARAARKKMQRTILDYGIKLLDPKSKGAE